MPAPVGVSLSGCAPRRVDLWLALTCAHEQSKVLGRLCAHWHRRADLVTWLMSVDADLNVDAAGGCRCRESPPQRASYDLPVLADV